MSASALPEKPLTLSDIASTDPLWWLEDSNSPATKKWVAEQNARTLSLLQRDPRYRRFHDTALTVAQDERRLPGSETTDRMFWHEGRIYVLFQDKTHPRGMWQRTTFESYRSASPHWEPMLDIDALAQQENKPWSLYTVDCYASRCLISLLSAGGAISTIREFDLVSRRFVSDGFTLPPAAGQKIVWKNTNTVLVMTDFGPGTLSPNGFPLVVKEWSRGLPLTQAQERFRGKGDGVALLNSTDETGAGVFILAQPTTGMQAEYFELPAKGEPVRLHVPPTAVVITRYRGEWLLALFDDWVSAERTWKAGTLLSISTSEIDRPNPPIKVVMEAGVREVLTPGIDVTSSGLLVASLKNVRGQLWRLNPEGDHWRREQIALPDQGKVRVALAQPKSPMALVQYESFLQPPSFYELKNGSAQATPLRTQPAHFAVDRYVTEQLEAISADGFKVPYFVVRPKAFRYRGTAPTLLHAYGNANSVSYVPTYDGVLGRNWLEHGGVFVLANIRGGGELGQEGYVRKIERRHTYEDFIAVSEDLIRLKITSPRHLGIWGHSMGGCLVGVSLNQHPELFHAAVTQNAVLDQIGWTAVIGNVHRWGPLEPTYVDGYGSLENPQEREFLESTSPYQNLKRQASFPEPFLATSTTDSVSPGITRRYGAKLASLGIPFYYYEPPEGGHNTWITPEQRAQWEAVFYTYLAQKLM